MSSFTRGDYVGYGKMAEDGARIYYSGSIGLLRPLLLVPQEADMILELYRIRGTIVSGSIVSRWFNHTFQICGRLCMPKLVPYNKFRPCNIEKAVEYIKVLARINPSQLKYADKKSLKGREIYNKLARQDPLTEIVPPTMTDPDLRNTYSIIGICGILRRSTPA